ncbi:DNA ligase 6-like protein, partial [Drosera capensis]
PEEVPEGIPDDVPEDVPDYVSEDVSCLSTYVSQPFCEDSTSLSDEEKEVIVKELHDCLPMWVDRGQMLELISSAGRNVVDAVSYFYEHETEFHDNSSACKNSKFISQSHSTIDSNSSSNISQPQSSLLEVVEISQSQNRKSLNLKYSQSHGASISPGKRKRNQGSKGNKKARVISNVEGGVKQATITNFFNKLASVTPQGDSAGNPTTSRSSIDEVALTPSSTKDGPADLMKGKCPDNEHASLADGDKRYEEALEQFMQVTNIGESARSYATTLIERAKGEINLALDIYYNNSEGHQNDNQMKMGSDSKHLLDGGGDYGCSSWQAELISSEPGKISHTYSTSTSEIVALTFVSLPMENYSPVEHACWKDGQPAPYIHLARTFDLLESEKGKIKATSMLCNMFRSLLALSPQDVLPAVYLCTNKIAPDHQNMELNIGGGLVTTALVEACGTNRNKIRDMYNRLGDLGDVAQECQQTQSLLIPPPSLLIKDVFSALREISIQSGTGSTAKRKGIILGLMRSCRDKEIKFIVRTLVRNLRIGAMMKTVLPSLAQAVVMSSFASSHLGKIDDLKAQLQRVSTAIVEAYNILPNLDMLVPSLLSKGMEFSSSTLTMVPGIPIRPMLAKITNGIEQALKIFENRAFTCEYKYDGQRAQIHKFANGSVHLFSRNGDEITSRFPDVVHIIQDACKCSATSFIIDTEVVAVDRRYEGKLLSFQELSSRERGGKRSAVSLDSIEVNVCVFLFDIMFINGEQILSCSLRQRRNYMKALFDDERLGCLEYAKEITVEADDACLDNEVGLTKMNTFLEDAIHSSCEGIMVKSLDVDAGYFPSKRGDTWLKVKRDYVEGLNDSLDLVPIGAWHGNGRKAGWYSPFLVACYNLDTEEYESVCRVMSGFSDSFYTEMKDFFSEDKILAKKPAYYRTAETPPMWFPPEVVWAIRGADFTVSPVHYAAIGLVHPSRGISLRFPRFIRMVNDRRPEDCSTSSDIADMFHSQTRKMDVSVVSKK